MYKDSVQTSQRTQYASIRKSCCQSRHAVLYAVCRFTVVPTNTCNCTVHWATSVRFHLQTLFLKHRFWYYLLATSMSLMWLFSVRYPDQNFMEVLTCPRCV